MRFSFAIHLPQPMHAPASELRSPRVAPVPEAVHTEPQPAPVRELPQELDQRVRELGEW